MKTPAGHQCKFYYEDFNRGRDTQECRLIDANKASIPWEPSDCTDCPIPGILRANGDPNLVLQGNIKNNFWKFGRKFEVSAFCSKHLIDVDEPHIGCTACAAERPSLEDIFGNLSE